MKQLALAALLALSAAPAAFAATSSQLLTNVDRAEIRRIVPGADLANLTDEQVQALAAVLSSDDRGDAIGGQIRAILDTTAPEATRGATLDAAAPYALDHSDRSDR